MKIGLFIPCYVDVVYPQVGVATYKLLTHLGLDVDYPLNQTCCGQPMANAGFEKQAIPLAEKFEDKFKGFDYVVAPSVSCTAFIKLNYPRLLKGKHECMTSSKIMDVVEFLHDVIKVDHPLGTFPHKVSLHNSCHGVRELGRVLWFWRYVLRRRDGHQCADGYRQGTTAHEDGCPFRDRARLFLPDAHGWCSQEARAPSGVQTRSRNTRSRIIS